MQISQSNGVWAFYLQVYFYKYIKYILLGFSMTNKIIEGTNSALKKSTNGRAMNWENFLHFIELIIIQYSNDSVNANWSK
jgi:hypothetical protein